MTRVGIALFVALLLVDGVGHVQGPLTGRWRMTDPVGHGTMTMTLFLEDGRLNGRIVAITDADGKSITPNCEHCLGDWNGRPLIGAVFIDGLQQSQGKWIDGHVVDLRRDSFARGFRANCEIELVGDRLRLYGYKLFHSWGRPSLWDRVPDAPAAPPSAVPPAPAP